MAARYLYYIRLTSAAPIYSKLTTPNSELTNPSHEPY